MERFRQQTIDTYDLSAEALAEKFRGIGPRILHIEQALHLAGEPAHARVLEIGCGDGRDAKEIIKRVDWYKGIDPSKGMIRLAMAHVQSPGAHFEVADPLLSEFPSNLDVIYAFASILHMSKEENALIMEKAADALRPGGIYYISTKERAQYESELQTDEFGTRLFYYYTPEVICELAGSNFELAALSRSQVGPTAWIEMALQKPFK
jgi:SAM-dependent methyltransferase